jgi:excisionase family DNA binding protein
LEAKEYLTIEEAAEYLGFNRTTLYKYMKELDIKGVKFRLDRRAYLSQADVKRLQEVKEKPWLAGIDEEKPEDEAA